MRTKFSWIPFIPVTIAMVALSILFSLNSADSAYKFLGFSASSFTYLNIFLSVALFVVVLIICLCDTRSANFHKAKCNPLCGIFAVLFALALAFDGANNLISAYSTGQWAIMPVIDIAFSIFAAVIFIVVGLGHFTGSVKTSAVLYVVPAIWCCLRLFGTYLENRTLSVSLIDVTYVVCLVFSTMFLFYEGEVLALINSKIALKSTIIFGLSGAAISLSYVAYKAVEFVNALTNTPVNTTENYTVTDGLQHMIDGGLDYYSYLPVLEVLFLALYMIFFVLELTTKVKEKYEVEIVFETEEKAENNEENETFVIESSESVDDIPNIENESNDEIYAKGEAIDKEKKSPDAKKAYAEDKKQGKTQRYLYKAEDYAPQEESKPAVEEKTNVDENQSTEQEDFGGVEDFIYKADKSYDANAQQNQNDADEYSKRMDDIDKLILQLSEDDYK